MQAVSRIVAFVVLGFLLSLPVLGADEKDKKVDPPKEEAKKADVKKEEPAKKPSDKKTAMPKLPPRRGKFGQLEDDPDAAYKKMLQKSPKVPATVVTVVEDKKSLRLRLTIPYVRINEGYLKNYLNAQVSMAQATDAQGIINARNSMAQAAARIYEVATVEKEVEWLAIDDVKVRMQNPPPQFDDKGRVKRPTAKELRELKGNDRLPGYPAEFSNIKTGQLVQVTLLQKKGGSRPIKRGKDAEAEVLPEDLPKMTFIMIVAEPKN